MATKKDAGAETPVTPAPAQDREQLQDQEIEAIGKAVQAVNETVNNLSARLESTQADGIKAAAETAASLAAVSAKLDQYLQAYQKQALADRQRVELLEKGIAFPVTDEMIAALKEPLPPEAVTPHPTKGFLTSIKTIFTIERLNEVFGVNGWYYTSEIVEAGEEKVIKDADKGDKVIPGMIVVKVTLIVPDYGIHHEAFGGNDNEDRGDAYKGAVTDAISKIGAMLYIGMDIYKGLGPSKNNGGRRTPQRNAAPTTAAVASEAGSAQAPVPPCDDCKGEIKTVEVSGEPYSPQQLVANSRKSWRTNPEDPKSAHDGPALCGACQRARRIKEREAKKLAAPQAPPPGVATSNGTAAPIR